MTAPAPSIAIARQRLRAARGDLARSAAMGRLGVWLGYAPPPGTAQRVAWERERGNAGFANRRRRRS